MSDFVHFEQAPPKSWEQFEELCADTFQEEFQDYALVRHGRQGQAQDGVDIVGRQGVLWPIGVQCKKKSRWPVKKVTIQDLNDEVAKAKQFKPALKVFYLVSTAPDDVTLQAHVRRLNVHHKQQLLFEVVVIGWGELERRAKKHHNVAAKHFGSYSTGPASPLIAAWQAANYKLELSDRELGVAIREVIHDLSDFPNGRILIRQKEADDLLFLIKERQAAPKPSLNQREAVVDLRDKLVRLRNRERTAVAGLKLLFARKPLSDYMSVWRDHAPLFVRSFVEQELDPDSSNIKGLEKIRIFPPGAAPEDRIAVFMPPQDISSIMQHGRELRGRFPNLETNNVSELPKPVQFKWAMPALVRAWISALEVGRSEDDLERVGWFDSEKWRFEL
jgi:hypothetical protein